MRRVVYPGSFDPVTLGHVDLIERGAKLFDELVVAVSVNVEKKPLFSAEERVRLLREVTRNLPNVSVEAFTGLSVDLVRRKGANALLRGIRTYSDLEYEFQMALTNRGFGGDVETVFILPREEYAFISARLVKEVARFGGDVSRFVPPAVADALRGRFGSGKPTGDSVPPDPNVKDRW